MPRRRRSAASVTVPPPLLRFDAEEWPGRVLPQYADCHPDAAETLSALARWVRAREDYAGPRCGRWPGDPVEGLFVRHRVVLGQVRARLSRLPGRACPVGLSCEDADTLVRASAADGWPWLSFGEGDEGAS